MKLKDLSGCKFGKLTVVKRVANKKSWTMYECVCDCSKVVITYSTHLLRGNVTSCGCNRPKGNRTYNWKGCGEITGDYWDHISRDSIRSSRQRRRNLKFELTIEYVWDLFIKQGRCCALTGIELSFMEGRRTASLYRIDSNGDYVEGNVQWVHKDINIMKNRFSQGYFVYMCYLVTEMNAKFNLNGRIKC